MKKQLLSAFAILGFTITSIAQIPNYLSSNGLVGYWPFNGNANDESGNGNNGTVNGATFTTDRNGNANCASSFNGISDYVSVNLNSISNTFPETSEYTKNAWVKTADLNGPIVSFSGDGGYESLLNVGTLCDIVQSPGNFGVLVRDNCCGTGNNIFGGSISNDTWHMITLIRTNNGVLKLFKDGELEISSAPGSSGALNFSTNTMAFGANLSWVLGSQQGCASCGTIDQQHLNGSLDDIGIWNRALSQKEIQQLYSGTSCVPPTASITAGGPTSFCIGGNVLLSAPSDTSYSYQWQSNGSNINAATAATYTANTSGDYSVIISNGASCSDTSAVTTVTVNPLPTVTLTSLPAFVNIQTLSVALNASPAGGSYSGQGISGTNFIPSTAGLGQAIVSYSYTSTAGCSGNIVKNTIVYDTTGTVCTSYDTIYTTINDTALVSVQDTLIIETLILGSNPIQSNEIKVYPNPAHSFLEIENGNFALMGGYTIRIENSLGQVVFNQAVNQQLFSINLSTWTGDGVYYLHIINSNGITQEIKKIVLQ
jgi:hypothetical protein